MLKTLFDGYLWTDIRGGAKGKAVKQPKHQYETLSARSTFW